MKESSSSSYKKDKKKDFYKRSTHSSQADSQDKWNHSGFEEIIKEQSTVKEVYQEKRQNFESESFKDNCSSYHSNYQRSDYGSNYNQNTQNKYQDKNQYKNKNYNKYQPKENYICSNQFQHQRGRGRGNHQMKKPSYHNPYQYKEQYSKNYEIQNQSNNYHYRQDRQQNFNRQRGRGYKQHTGYYGQSNQEYYQKQYNEQKFKKEEDSQSIKEQQDSQSQTSQKLNTSRTSRKEEAKQEDCEQDQVDIKNDSIKIIKQQQDQQSNLALILKLKFSTQNIHLEIKIDDNIQQLLDELCLYEKIQKDLREALEIYIQRVLSEIIQSSQIIQQQENQPEQNQISAFPQFMQVPLQYSTPINQIQPFQCYQAYSSLENTLVFQNYGNY